MTRHLSVKIANLLKLSNRDLKKLFSRDANELRLELREKQCRGEIFIGSEGCEKFNPFTGCKCGEKVYGFDQVYIFNSEFGLSAKSESEAIKKFQKLQPPKIFKSIEYYGADYSRV